MAVTNETFTADLVDGRVLSVPLAWSWRLSEATPAQRAHWTLIGNGDGGHWPEIDEDLRAEGLLNGVPPRDPAVRRGTAALRARVSRGPVYTQTLRFGINPGSFDSLVPIQVRGERCDLRMSWATVVNATRMLQLFLASITSVSFPRRRLAADPTLRLQGDQSSERLRIAVEELWCGSGRT